MVTANSLDLGLFVVSPRAFTFVVAVAALNLFVLWVMRRVSLTIELREVIAEKDPAMIKARQELLTKHLAYLKERATLAKDNAITTDPDPPKTPDPIPESSSRLAGVLGALVLVAALWAFANFLVWASFWDRDVIKPVMEHVGTFFISGSALFLPYAFNRLSTVFGPGNR